MMGVRPSFLCKDISYNLIYQNTSNDSNSSNLKFQRSYQNFTMYPCLLLNEPLLIESCCKCSFLCMESDIRLSNYTHLLPSHWTSYVKKKLYIIHNQWISILSLILPIIYIGGCFSPKIDKKKLIMRSEFKKKNVETIIDCRNLPLIW